MPPLSFSSPQSPASPSPSPSPWRPRSLYTCVFIWISIVGGRFLAPFLEHEASLTSTQIGSLLAVQQLVYVLASSVSGGWADSLEKKYPGKGRTAVMAIGISSGGALFLFHGVARMMLISRSTRVDIVSTTSTTTQQPLQSFFHSVLWHGAIRILFAASNSLVFPVMDGICLDYLRRQPSGSTRDYGKERVYGAISWGVANVMLAFALDYLGFVVFYGLAAVATTSTLILLRLFSQTMTTQQRSTPQKVTMHHRGDDADGTEMDSASLAAPNDADQPHTSTSSSSSSAFRLLRFLMSSWFGVCFIMAQITQSSGQATVDSLVFLFFEFLGSTYGMMGFTVVLTVAFEIPIFHIAPKLLNQWGPGRLIQIAALSYVIRVIGYTLVPRSEDGQAVKASMYCVFLLEPLHGVTFACSAAAGVEFLSSICPAGYEASGQSLLQVLVGTGSVLGLFFGGWLQDTLGPRIMYRISAFVVFVGCLIFSTALCFCKPPPTSGNNHTEIPRENDPKIGEKMIEMLGLQTSVKDETIGLTSHGPSGLVNRNCF